MDTGSDHDEEFGLYQAQCAGCDLFTSVNEVGLCSSCAGTLERDMIRERQWAYSALAFGVPSDRLEQLRQLVTKQHGETLELIAPTGTKRSTKNDANPASPGEKHGRRKR